MGKKAPQYYIPQDWPNYDDLSYSRLKKVFAEENEVTSEQVVIAIQILLKNGIPSDLKRARYYFHLGKANNLDLSNLPVDSQEILFPEKFSEGESQ